jgi:Dyp-type peroxidase family
MTATPEKPVGPVEPVLPMTDIQGIVVPGFAKQHQTLLGIRVPTGVHVTINFKELIRRLAEEVSTAELVLRDRRLHHELRNKLKEMRPVGSPELVLMAVAFSHTGIAKLTPGAQWIESPAFRIGLAGRSAMLGDPTGAGDEGNPMNWKIGKPGEELDALFILAGDDRGTVTAKAKALMNELEKYGVDIPYHEDGDIRDDLPGHEHFGFDDGVSQPAIRGLASEDPEDFISARYVSRDRVPECYLFGYPGQDLVWPGEFVLGQPASSPDPLVPGISNPTIPGWTRNGSFLVFRRLRQDVGLFWRTMADIAGGLKKTTGFEEMSDERLASRLVGRWPSGAPVNRVPDKDDEKLGQNPYANNHFRFDSDSGPLPLEPPGEDPFPMSSADSAGTTCPWAAHIRKVNTRDSASDLGGRDSTYTRRILRVGIPFGKPLEDRYMEKDRDPEKGERGLLFLSIQASIENQFEFLMTRWMGDPTRPKMPGGHDLLVGQNDAVGEGRIRKCSIFGRGLQQAVLQTDAQWIIPTGGGYFFVPSIRTLKEVLGA